MFVCVNHQEVTPINKHASKDSLECRKQKLAELKKEIHNSTMIIGDINTPLPIMNKTVSQKINKEKKILTL